MGSRGGQASVCRSTHKKLEPFPGPNTTQHDRNPNNTARPCVCIVLPHTFVKKCQHVCTQHTVLYHAVSYHFQCHVSIRPGVFLHTKQTRISYGQEQDRRSGIVRYNTASTHSQPRPPVKLSTAGWDCAATREAVSILTKPFAHPYLTYDRENITKPVSHHYRCPQQM